MGTMKIRIGVSLGPAAGPEGFAAAVDELEARGVDSLWLSEMVFGSLVEPFTGMAYALSRTANLKVGTGVAVLPGRHPVLVAKQLASLASLAPRRVLPVFGLQPARRSERALFPAPPGRRGVLFDESLELLRLLLAQDEVSFSGEFFTVEGASIGPRPAKPLDIWLGGSAPAGLRRIGRFGDGWLGSFRTPAETRGDVATIQQAASAAGREIELDHFGISLAVGRDGLPPELAAAIADRRPDVSPADLAAGSWSQARAMIEAYVESGLSKFVIRPAGRTESFGQFLDEFAAEMLPLQN
jgi:probable F420-dependent oxidoreductase